MIGIVKKGQRSPNRILAVGQEACSLFAGILRTGASSAGSRALAVSAVRLGRAMRRVAYTSAQTALVAGAGVGRVQRDRRVHDVDANPHRF